MTLGHLGTALGSIPYFAKHHSLFSLALLIVALLVWETLRPGIQIAIQPIGVPSRGTDDGFAPGVVALRLIGWASEWTNHPRGWRR